MTAKPTGPEDAAAGSGAGADGTSPRQRPRVLARRLAAHSRIFRVEAVDLEFSNGARRTFERVLGGRDSVMIVPMPDPHTVLLVREYAAGSDDYQLGFPKGLVDPGEDMLAAAAREIREEVGFAARDLRELHRVTLAPGYIQHGTRLVLARGLYPSAAAGDEPEPLQVVPWRLDDLDGLLARPDFTEARSIAALFLTRRFLDGEIGDGSGWT